VIHFIGTSFAATHLKQAAIKRGLEVTDDYDKATLLFVSEDTPTDENGVRDLDRIRDLVPRDERPVILTSQVPVGFTRSLMKINIYHQAETLRIKDAVQRAMYPEQIIVGMGHWVPYLPEEYQTYLAVFGCPVHYMMWEEAEFAKIAINMTLISQVENTNRLAAYAEKRSLNWHNIKSVLETDSRIGRNSYLTPGRWQDSPHLLRDYVTFNEDS
jgi:UDP-glucose 6-dehydrogenase